MNRLIIIGNGFDLAHKLKTSYNDFISNYWSSFLDSGYNDELIEFSNVRFWQEWATPCKSLVEIHKIFGNMNIVNGRSIYSYSSGYQLIFKNVFFKKINEKHSLVNWVDIEMEYYNTLKEMVLRQGEYVTKHDDLISNAIVVLNKEIMDLTKRFEDYLIRKVIPEIKKNKNKLMFEIFSNPILDEKEFANFYKEFSRKSYLHIVKTHTHLPQVGEAKFANTLILNFNYTSTVQQYLESRNNVSYIHGEIENIKNSILLGFGDEMDKHYNNIEDANNNEFLRFMKSAHYSKNSNYKHLFDFIEDSFFQVQILGHSCGLSDRTLLNSIFENPNCVSIKPYYYQYEEINEYGELDNYSDIMKNISRHFNDKKIMRDKIVNYEYCSPLPQSK